MPAFAELSLANLVKNHTMNADAAALLWAIAARRGSAIVASPPQKAGKSTMLHAFVDLWPPQTNVVQTGGYQERLEFLNTTDPTTTGILVNEFSDHVPTMYLSGHGGRVAKVFAALARGYCVAGTMHCGDPDEVLDEFASPPNSVLPGDLGRLSCIAIIGVWRGTQGIIRRLDSLSIVMPGSSPDAMPETRTVVEFDMKRDNWNTFATKMDLQDTAKRLQATPEMLATELAARKSALEHLIQQGATSPETFRQRAWELVPATLR